MYWLPISDNTMFILINPTNVKEKNKSCHNVVQSTEYQKTQQNKIG